MSTEPPPDGRRRGPADLLIAAAVAAAALATLVGTARDFAPAWDEGFTVQREEALEKWFEFLARPPAGFTRARAFSPALLRHSWRFGREEPDGHPPFYALLGLAGWHLARGWAPPLTAYRFGPMALAAATAGAVYLHLVRRLGRTAGLTGAGALLLMPRTFAHAHYAHYDMPMTCLWLLAQWAFIRSVEAPGAAASWAWRGAFGAFWGLSAASKFTGLLVPVGPALWVLATAARVRTDPAARRLVGRGVGALAVGLPLAAAVLVAVQPPWWYDPAGAFARFVASNTSRARTIPIPTQYLGRLYSFSLPWHNTLVLTVATTPVVLLGLGAVGVVTGLARRRSEPWMLVWVASWLVLMAVRALPGAPGHDGVRLFLPSVASLAVLAGVGAGALARGAPAEGRAWVVAAVAALGLGEAGVGIAQTYPYTDAYFSAAVGGLPGAERLGFELTYYWDTQGHEFLDWLARASARRRVVLRFPSPLITQTYLRRWGLWPANALILGTDPVPEDGAPEHYVLQRRGGTFLPEDWWLDRHGRPEFVVRRQGVDLLRVYPPGERERARDATRHVPIPAPLRPIAPPDRL